jgi:hypothetical protein
MSITFEGTWTVLEGDILTHCTQTLAFGGLGRNLLCPRHLMEARVFVGFVDLEVIQVCFWRMETHGMHYGT